LLKHGVASEGNPRHKCCCLRDFFPRPPYQILDAWRKGEIQLIVSEDIFDEYQRVGEILSLQFSPVDPLPVLTMLKANSEIVVSERLPAPVSDDPDDDKFLACALAAKCKLIISGDKHLLKMSGFEGIKVLKPREFVNVYLGK
jgi:uncharacterized protein